MTEFEKAVEQQLEGVEAVSTGLCSGCQTCLDDWNCSAEDIESGAAFDEGMFSGVDCEGCGSSLAGDRHAAHGLVDDDLVHLVVCTDCLLYLANGDIPENWEG